MQPTNLDIFIAPEIQLIYKSTLKDSERPKVTSSDEAFRVFYKTWDENKIDLVEQFKVLLLNRRNKVLGIYEHSTGGTKSTLVDKRLVFAAALKANALSILLAHNHPSGDCEPSKADIEMTMQLTAAGNLLDIAVLDHLIVTRDGYYSISEERAYQLQPDL